MKERLAGHFRRLLQVIGLCLFCQINALGLDADAEIVSVIYERLQPTCHSAACIVIASLSRWQVLEPIILCMVDIGVEVLLELGVYAFSLTVCL